MKTKLVSILSGLSMIAIFVFAVVQLNKSRSLLAIFAIFILFIPMYFLFAALVQGKYKKSDKKAEDKNSRKKAKQRDWKEGDFGKVLEFPSDKKKKG
ncbi:MAG: hypothetical protein JXN65_08270 [Clostridia bacterium]|nr:hypothetical protein [Clostridia bacterium]